MGYESNFECQIADGRFKYVVQRADTEQSALVQRFYKQ